MGALNRFEQRLEHMVTGAFARAFRSAVQPMEIAAALQREVDNSAQILSRDRRLAPNMFRIDLAGSDFDRLSTYGEALSRELAAMLHEHASEQHYMFAGPVKLNFLRVDDLTTGRFRVRSEASAAVTPPAGQQASDTSITKTAMFLDVNGVRHPLAPPGVVIGRGTNADLRIDDPGISRRHVEFRVQVTDAGPAVSVLDLGSTNGTTVNGQRVQHAALEDGSVVQIGSTHIVVHAGASSDQPRPNPRPGSAPAQQSASQQAGARQPQRRQPPTPYPPPGEQHYPSYEAGQSQSPQVARPSAQAEGRSAAAPSYPTPASSSESYGRPAQQGQQAKQAKPASRWGRKKQQPPPFRAVNRPPGDSGQRPWNG